MSPKRLEHALAADDSTLHYHLNELLNVGLVEKRQRTERDQNGLYTYSRVTVFGGSHEHGVDEPICGEREFKSMYNSSSEAYPPRQNRFVIDFYRENKASVLGLDPEAVH